LRSEFGANEAAGHGIALAAEIDVLTFEFHAQVGDMLRPVPAPTVQPTETLDALNEVALFTMVRGLSRACESARAMRSRSHRKERPPRASGF
jgi:hypothetical protein